MGWYLSSMLLHCLFMVFFYCLVSSENSLPNDASVVDGDLLKFAPCMPWGCWCATDGLCNWHSVQSQRGLLKSASSPLNCLLWLGASGRHGLIRRTCLTTQFCIHMIYCLVWMEELSLTSEKSIPPLCVSVKHLQIFPGKCFRVSIWMP